MQDRSDRGVRIFEDHRDNLTIDVESDLVLGRAAEMRSENSESALLWNVFRALQRIDARRWLPRLVHRALGDAVGNDSGGLAAPDGLGDVEFHWWERWELPPARLAVLHERALSGDLRLDHWAARSAAERRTDVERRLAADLPFEDPVEIPLCIETPRFLLAVTAVFKGNLRRHTPFDSHRDEVLRLLDAASWAAAASGKRCLTLVVCADPRHVNLETARLVDRYRGRPERLVDALPHRDDRAVLAAAAESLALARWKDMGALLLATKDEERLGLFDVAALDELIKYLARKDVGFNFFRRLK